MAEIKSAVELALEKTKGLSLSGQEKEKIKEEEIQAKARSLVNRFLQADFHPWEMEKELAKVLPAEREHLKNLVYEYLGEAVRLEGENEKVFEVLETLRPGSKEILKKIASLTAAYQEEKEKESQKTAQEILNRLGRLGIRGSAVQPRMEGSPEWKQALERLQPPFAAQLQRLREELCRGNS